MENELKIGGIYRHFKGNDKLYKIEKSLCEYLTQLTFSCKMSMT